MIRTNRLNQADSSRPSALLSPPIAIAIPTKKPKQNKPVKFKPTKAKKANIYFFIILKATQRFKKPTTTLYFIS